MDEGSESERPHDALVDRVVELISTSEDYMGRFVRGVGGRPDTASALYALLYNLGFRYDTSSVRRWQKSAGGKS